ncbi:MAG: glycosyltransferase family 4 protein, partial [Planctomycetota bacterium]
DYLRYRSQPTVLPNGVPDLPVDAGKRVQARRELGVPEDAFVFLAAGNARPEKGFEDLLEAAGRLRGDGAGGRAVVLVAGGMDDSPYCRMLRERHRDWELDGTVRFLGFRSDMPELYAAADAFVLPSRSEGLPMVVLESMMAGLPIVATRVGGVPAAIGEGGLVVDPADPADLAAAMGRLALEEGVAAELGQRARRRAKERFGIEAMVSRYADLYRSVARRRSRSERGT